MFEYRKENISWTYGGTRFLKQAIEELAKNREVTALKVRVCLPPPPRKVGCG